MSDPPDAPDPRFDALHPGGMVLFRSCREGYLHSVVLSEGVREADPRILAEAILLSARVSHLKAVMRMRQEIIDAGFTPSDEVASPADLEAAEVRLIRHWSP